MDKPMPNEESRAQLSSCEGSGNASETPLRPAPEASQGTADLIPSASTAEEKKTILFVSQKLFQQFRQEFDGFIDPSEDLHETPLSSVHGCSLPTCLTETPLLRRKVVIFSDISEKDEFAKGLDPDNCWHTFGHRRLHHTRENTVALLYINSKEVEPHRFGHSKEERAKRKALMRLPRGITFCPITDCGTVFSLTSMLAHCLYEHPADEPNGLEFVKVCTDQPRIVMFDASMIGFYSNKCLAVLGYAGPDESRESLPGMRGVCWHDSCLKDDLKYLNSLLPIMLMASRSSLCALDGQEELGTKEDQKEKELLILWLVAPPTTKPIQVTIKVFDRYLNPSARLTTKVRMINESQEAVDIERIEFACVRLTHKDIQSFTDSETKPMFLEVIVHENDEAVKKAEASNYRLENC